MPLVHVPAEYEISTLLAGVTAGSIGVAGHRGAGKTTLLRTICRSSCHGDTSSGGKPVLGVLTAAPVSYDPREFLLYLFARICEEVQILGASAGSAGAGRPDPAPAWSVAAFMTRRLVALGAAMLGLGALGTAVYLHSGHRIAVAGLRPLWLPETFWWAAGAVAFLLAACILMRIRRQRRRALGAGHGWQDLLTEAARWQATIKFQQSFTTGWSGSVSAPFGTSLSRSRMRQFADRELTFPDVVDDLQRFIRKIGQNGIQTRIGIDELDKMDRDDAATFLNSIKAIFGVENCFFLVSVSDDALSDFERRGLPLRNAFDSSLYEIVRVSVLEFDGAKRLLNSRTLMGEPFPANFAALWYAERDGLCPDQVVTECAELSARSRTAERPGPADEGTDQISALALETCGYRYFVATALQFFSLDEQRVMQALSAEAGPPGIATMAQARMTFARDPRLAWGLVSEFRTACGLPPAPTPPDPGAPMLDWFADAANARLNVSGAGAGQR